MGQLGRPVSTPPPPHETPIYRRPPRGGHRRCDNERNAQDDIASERARSVINGIILGGRVGPDFYGLFRPTSNQG
jgi:hypothetical protein